MLDSRPRMRFIAVLAAVACLNLGCGAGSNPAPAVSGRATPTMTGSSQTPAGKAAGATPVAIGGRLIVLADGETGGPGLWALGSDSRWTAVAAIPGATALGRTADGIGVATKVGIEARDRGDLSKPKTVAVLKWFGQAPAAPIVDLDYSAGGKAALVASDDTGLTYAVARADGTLISLAPAPTQSFTPLIRWLDEDRALVLSTDEQQVSRLTVVDTAAHTLTPARALSGVRVFALSGDRQVVAAASETAIYVASLAAFDGASAPPPSVTLVDSQVVWGIALDQGGSRLFTLSGMLAPDGSIASVHELVYALEGSTWTKVLDSTVPFGRAIAQVYLP